MVFIFVYPQLNDVVTTQRQQTVGRAQPLGQSELPPDPG